MTPALLAELPACEAVLEGQAHQRNCQTAADFPPGSTVHLSGSHRRWMVDKRLPNGSLLLVNEGIHRQLDADSMWRIDATR